jgi:citrate lyase beta subunit
MFKKMNYFVVSQNLLKSSLKLPGHTILRVNLAWHKDLDSVKEMLCEYKDRDVFLDIPIGRKKPPNHNHDLDNIIAIANAFSNVKYVAISNVEDPETVGHYCKKFKAKIVPKIETLKGATMFIEIVSALNYKPQIIMLDHEDLFSNLTRLKKEDQYLDIVNQLVDTCREKGIHLLRVKGIIFSDD